MNKAVRKSRVRFAALALSALTAGSAALAAPMSVQVKDAQVRAKPSFLGAVTGSLAYGDRVEAGAKQGDWYPVTTADGKQGWLHNSALSQKRIVMQAGNGGANAGATGEEVALAGKGFNADVEKQYRSQNQSLNFAAVDRLEAVRVAPRVMQEFVQKGELKAAGGAQ